MKQINRHMKKGERENKCNQRREGMEEERVSTHLSSTFFDGTEDHLFVFVS